MPLMCGPYGDYDAVNSTCICDSGYSVIDFNDTFEQTLGFFCIKQAEELCTYSSPYYSVPISWDGNKCSPSNSCNNNLICDIGEDSMNCPMDCGGGGSFCGNGMCESWNGESSMSCPMDCGGGMTCNNNGTCESWNGEDSANCASDCSCSSQTTLFNCQQTPSCNWFYPMIDCPAASDSMSCTQANASCYWTPSYQDCSMNFNNNEFGCNSQSGCMWMPNDMMDPFAGGTCSGQYQDYNSGPGTCTGQYQDQSGMTGYCY